jgi:glycosyltransferase involved in cell wall biosynthesis
MATNYRMQRDICLSDFVIYQSAFSKEMADHFLYNRQSDYAIVFNGVDLDNFRPVPFRSRRRRLLSCGEIRHEYMLGTVLPVFKEIWRDYDLELSIVGSLDSLNREMLDEFVQSEPEAGRRIEWVGFVPNIEIPKFMQQSDILIHPRLGDNCPNTVIEALACGLPVVCGSWGGTAELVGDAGIVVPTGQWGYGEQFSKGLADGVVQILRNLDHYKIIARSRAEAEFDIRHTVSKYLQALNLQNSYESTC